MTVYNSETANTTDDAASTETRILVLSQQALPAITDLDPEYTLDTLQDASSAMEALRHAEYDLVLLHDAGIEADIADITREIKRRYPLVPMLILMQARNVTYETDLVEAGVDDLLEASVPADELRRRVLLMMRQRLRNRALARRNRNLHSINILAQRLHNATAPQMLVMEMIDLVCSTFGLYGLVIALEEGSRIHLYAGSAGLSDVRQLYESVVSTHPYDLFGKTIETGNVQIYHDLTAYRYYVSIPVLPDATNAVILPLLYGDTMFGALGVLGTPENPVSRDDLVIYELIAGHFSTAYHNIAHYHAQAVSAQSSRHLLRAWQRLSNLGGIEEIARTLHELIGDTPRTSSALVWLYGDDRHADEVIVVADTPEAEGVFRKLQSDGHIDSHLNEQFDDQMQPLSLWLGVRGSRNRQDMLGPLFRALGGGNSNQLLVLPITDAVRLIGGVVVANSDGNAFSVDETNLMESITHAAGQALERIVLISAMEEQTGRLDAILRSVDDQGIFFVADTGKVVYCNPQFTKLTGVNISDVLSYPPDNLLDLLAARAVEPGKLRSDVQTAIESLLAGRKTSIIEVRMQGSDTPIYIDFIPINLRDTGNSSWIGIIRDDSRFVDALGTSQRYLLDVLSESLSVPYAQLQTTISMLLEQHGTFSNRERERLLRRLDHEGRVVGQLWENFRLVYKLQVTGLEMEPEEVYPRELVEQVLSRQPFVRHRHHIRVDATPPQSTIHVDEMQTRRVLGYVLENAIKFSPPDAPIAVQIKTEGRDVHINVQDLGVGIPGDQIDHIFNPFYQTERDSHEGVGLGLYLARELVERQGGRIMARSRRNKGTIISIVLPVAQHQVDGLDPDTLISGFARTTEMGAPVHQADRVLVVEGHNPLDDSIYDRLEQDGYELHYCTGAQEALNDLSLARFDLVLVDNDQGEVSGVETCRRIRKAHEVPIVLLSRQPATPNEPVHALNAGADEFIDGSATTEVIIARVRNIVRRVHLQPGRSREPLELEGLFIDFANREVYVNNQIISLTRIEYDLLYELATNRNQLLTHEYLLEKVWGPEFRDENQYLWVNVSRLRRKIERDPSKPRYIQTQTGQGYIFRDM